MSPFSAVAIPTGIAEFIKACRPNCAGCGCWLERGRITQNHKAPKPKRISPNKRSRPRAFDFRGGGDGGEGFSCFGWVICVLILVWRSNRGPLNAFVDSRILPEISKRFRDRSRGKTGYIDDALTRAMTLLSDKRPLAGTSGSGKAMAGMVGRGSRTKLTGFRRNCYSHHRIVVLGRKTRRLVRHSLDSTQSCAHKGVGEVGAVGSGSAGPGAKPTDSLRTSFPFAKPPRRSGASPTIPGI